MNLEDNKFNCSVSQTFNPTNLKTMIEELRKITGINSMPMILCNPMNYELAKELLNSVCVAYNIIKSSYAEENTITVITDKYTKTGILEFLKQKNLFYEG